MKNINWYYENDITCGKTFHEFPWFSVHLKLIQETDTRFCTGTGWLEVGRALRKDRERFEEDFREVRQQCGVGLGASAVPDSERAMVARIREQTKSLSLSLSLSLSVDAARRLVHIDAEHEGLGDALVASACPRFLAAPVVCASQASGRDMHLVFAGAFAFSPLLRGEILAETPKRETHALVNLNSAMIRPCWPAQCRHRSFRRPWPHHPPRDLSARSWTTHANAPRCCRRCLACTTQRGMQLAFASRKSTIRGFRWSMEFLVRDELMLPRVGLARDFHSQKFYTRVNVFAVEWYRNCLSIRM